MIIKNKGIDYNLGIFYVRRRTCPFIFERKMRLKPMNRSWNPLGTLVGNGRPKSESMGASRRIEMTDTEYYVTYATKNQCMRLIYRRDSSLCECMPCECMPLALALA